MMRLRIGSLSIGLTNFVMKSFFGLQMAFRMMNS